MTRELSLETEAVMAATLHVLVERRTDIQNNLATELARLPIGANSRPLRASLLARSVLNHLMEHGEKLHAGGAAYSREQLPVELKNEEALAACRRAFEAMVPLIVANAWLAVLKKD